MNKLLKSIVCVATGLAMAIGVGTAVLNGEHFVPLFAADETVDFSAQGYSNQQAIASYSGSNFDITFDKGSNSNAPKYYTSGSAIRAYGGNTITVSSSTKTISCVEWTFGSSDGSNAISADVGDYSSGTWAGEAKSIVFTIGGTTGNRRLAGIAVTFKTAGYTVSYNSNGGTGTMSDENSPYSANSTVTVKANSFTRFGYDFDHWNTKADDSGDDYDPGETFSIAANTILFAQWVENPDVSGTAWKPYTIAEAKDAIDNGGQVTDVYVGGIVSQVGSFSSGQITYWISDDGTTSNQFEVYNGKGLNNAAFSSANDVKVGANAVVFGNIKLYQTTYEFAGGNHLYSYSYTPPVRTLSSIAVSGDYQTSFNVGDAFNHNGAVVTATFEGGATEDVSASAEFSNPDMSSAGTKTVSVSYSENGVTKTASYDITVEALPEGQITVTKTIDEIIAANNYTVSSGNNATCYTSFALDNNITISTTGSANCGAFYTSGSNHEWRLYQNKSGNVIATASAGYELVSVTYTYSASNTGVLKKGTTNISSGTAVAVSEDSSLELTVGNTGDATNGQVRITGISVTYAEIALSNDPRDYLASASPIRTIRGTENNSYGNEVTTEVTFSSVMSDGGLLSANPVTIGQVSLTGNKGTQNSNEPKYYSNGTALRFYSGNNLIFSANNGFTISKIEITFVDGYEHDLKDENNASIQGVWTGLSDTVTLIGTDTTRVSGVSVSYKTKSFDSIASLDLRFGVKILAEDWDIIAHNSNWVIEDYGVMMFMTSKAKESTAPSVESRYDDTKAFDEQTLVSVGHRDSGATPALSGQDHYNFTVRVNVPSDSWYDAIFCVAPFVKINGEVIFLLDDDIHESVRSLADQNDGTNLSEAALTYLKGPQGGN